MSDDSPSTVPPPPRVVGSKLKALVAEARSSHSGARGEPWPHHGLTM